MSTPVYASALELRDFLNVDMNIFTEDVLNKYLLMAEGWVERVGMACWGGKKCDSGVEYHTLLKYLGGYWCMKHDTEVLTVDRGWVPAYDLKVGEKVYVVRASDLKVVTGTITHLDRNRNYEGGIAEINIEGEKFLMTEAHYLPGMSVKYSKKGVVAYPKFLQPHMLNSHYRLIRAGYLDGIDEPYVDIAGYTFRTEDWMRFYGLWLAEGTIEYKKSGKPYRLSIGQYRTSKVYDEVIRTVESLGLKYHVNGKIIRLNNVSLATYFADELGYRGVHARDKFIHREFLNYNWRYLRELIYGYWLGDGHHKEGKHIEVATASERLRDDLMEAGVKAGYAVHYRIQKTSGGRYSGYPLYIVSFSEKKKLFKPRKEKVRIYNGRMDVVGFTVEPGHTVITRVGTRTLAQGNWGLGTPVHLRYKPVKEFIELKVFNGSEWEDWLNEKTEARNTGDWWCDYEEGIIYLNTFWYYQGGKEVRVRYYYGYDDLPWYVKELTLLQAAKYILLYDRRRLALVETGESMDVRSMMDWVDKRIDELLPLVRGVTFVTGTNP